MKLLFCVIFLVSNAAVSAAQEATIRVGDVLSAVTGYQNSNYYRAILVQGEEDADLYIFGRPDGDLIQVAYARNIAYTGIGGTDAYLGQSENGAIELISQNIAIGRHRWEQKLTIVYRDRRYLIGGFTYRYYDTIAVDSNGEVKTGNCDLNLLTGAGIKDGQSIRTKLTAVPIEDWSVEFGPDECSDE